MVDNAATMRPPDPGGPRRPRPKRKPPVPRPRGRAQNPPQIDIVNAASPIEEAPIDYTNASTVFSTGQGGAEMYHYDRKPMQTQEQLARPESTTVTNPGGPGQP
jgi:hypothetical protein